MIVACLYTLRRLSIAYAVLTLATAPAKAEVIIEGFRAIRGMVIFSENCFSPFLTEDKAAKVLSLRGTDLADTSYDFYDLDPFSSAAPSPATKRAVTPGTDRRCEIAFPGDYSEKAAKAAAEALQSEGITTPAALPAAYTETTTTTLLAARRLNPRRVAIVHVGTRQGAQGTKTFMLVERLTPTDPNN